MGHSQADKAMSRERILAQAAAQLREGGLASIGVGRLMRSVNLTHGGFYGHFASRSELLAQALERALVDGASASRAASPSTGGAAGKRFIHRYLSRAHRDARKDGCAVAALAADVARADEASRTVMTAHIERFIARLGDSFDGDEEAAMFAASAMVGALLLSRVVTDPKRSDALLQAVRERLTDPPSTEGPPHAG